MMLALLFLLPRVAAGNDELRGGFVRAGFLALGRKAPRGHGMTSTGGASLAAAVRMINRVHGHAAIVRPPAHPARAPGLADRDVHVVGIGHRADRAHAAAVHQALLGRMEPHDNVILVATDDLRVGPSRTRDLATLADLELDI